MGYPHVHTQPRHNRIGDSYYAFELSYREHHVPSTYSTLSSCNFTFAGMYSEK